MINYFFGVAVNAARGVAYQVESAMMQFFHSFMTSVKPQIVKLYATGQIKEMLSLVFASSKYAFFLLYIIALPVFLDTDYILSIWLKKVPDAAALFLRCVIIVSMIRTFAAPIVQAVHATGNIKRLNLYAGGATILLTIPLTYLFYRLGYPAEVTFFVSGVASLLCNYLELIVLKKEIPFSILQYVIRIYGISLLIVLLSAIPLYCLHHSLETSFFRLVLVCISDLVLVGLLIFFIGMSAEDRQKIIVFLKNKIMYYVKR
jgi:Na+-driven multidrug efflux pump